MIAAGQVGVMLTSVGRFTGEAVRMGRSEAPLSEVSEVFRSSFGATFG